MKVKHIFVFFCEMTVFHLQALPFESEVTSEWTGCAHGNLNTMCFSEQ